MGGLGNPLSAGGATTHATVEADLAWHVPDDFKLADAPTFGIAGSTAAFALYYILGVPFPPHQEEGWLAISGGSTQVGLFFIQYAKLSGFKVVATSSEKNFGLLKEYGADEVVDYHDPEAVEKIRKFKPRFVAELAGGSSWDLSGAIGGERYVAVLENPESKSEYVGYGRVFKPVSWWARAMLMCRARHSTPRSGSGLLSYMRSAFQSSSRLVCGLLLSL